MSTQITRLPNSASPAPETKPTYPVPTTVIILFVCAIVECEKKKD